MTLMRPCAGLVPKRTGRARTAILVGLAWACFRGQKSEPLELRAFLHTVVLPARELSYERTQGRIGAPILHSLQTTYSIQSDQHDCGAVVILPNIAAGQLLLGIKQ